ncbi:unnamed protein product [Linum trigynum]|uniref:Gnk2-homologous domain-containing protein n=1 Tax=Linum trigynum TaxID=586398 RepID=A0AAV2CBM1_9ROSI
MKSSLLKLLTLLLVIVVVAAAGSRVKETSSSTSGPYCLNTGSSADYEAHKAHVLDELANVTPTMEGYSYSTSFPPAGSAAAQDVVYGSASCTPDVGVTECVSCLIEAKLSLAQSCAYDFYGLVILPLCRMSFSPVAE